MYRLVHESDSYNSYCLQVGHLSGGRPLHVNLDSAFITLIFYNLVTFKETRLSDFKIHTCTLYMRIMYFNRVAKHAPASN